MSNYTGGGLPDPEPKAHDKIIVRPILNYNSIMYILKEKKLYIAHVFTS